MKTKLIHSNSSASLRSIPSNVTSFTEEDEDAPRKRKFCQKIFRRRTLERLLPIVKWLPEYNGKKAFSDLIAGVTVGLTVLPQGLAYATVAGLPPIYGLYSSFVGCFVYILFGSTKQITIGPTAIQSVLTNKYISGKPPEYAIFLTAVTGVVTTFIGAFQLGFIANFISRPVISGFISGVSVIILATQLTQILGWHYPKEQVFGIFQGLIEHTPINKWDAILGACSIVVLFALQKLQWLFSPVLSQRPTLDKGFWFFSTARSAMVLFVSSVTCFLIDPIDQKDRMFSLIDLDGFQNLTSGIPPFKPPPTTIYNPNTNETHSFTELLLEESSAIIVLPLLGLLGHITIAKAFSGSKQVDCSQEILCIGITNIISSFLSSYSVGGSFSRTTVNAFSGVESPMGGLYTGIVVLLALQFLTQYFYFIPKASLAAVIICSVIFMIDWDIILSLWRSKRMDLIPLSITFLVTILVGIDYGILIGLIISTLTLLYNAARPRFKVLEAETGRFGNKFIMIVLDRSLTFPSVDYITYEIQKSVLRFGTKRTPSVLDCHHIQYTDFTAAEAMKNLLESLHDQDHHLIFYRLKRSMLLTVKGIMHDAATHFVHCETESDLEALIDGGVVRVHTTDSESASERSIRNTMKALMQADKNKPKPRRRGSMFE